MRPATRVVVVAALLLVLGGLCVHYGATYDDNWPHPTGDRIQDAGLEQSVGDRVLLFGEVRSVDAEAETITIQVTDDSGEVAAELEVRGVASDVKSGGDVQVYGLLESETELAADRTVVVNRDPSATTYKLGASVVGLLLAVGYFLRHWRVTGRELAFEPRVDPATSDGGPKSEENRRG
ncbi:DNA-binding protein [Natrinema ejinorense]|uniref:DNA-binding protein n=1 Tax=Natrinema ejinorense TaxID=373386 RepID=A0A2A5QUK5_9EURY|nr:DNA-binding protein [Natrinema ejinorense]PCR90463.1 DNA-binding protein [Natrinema ejinorense]